MFVINVTTLTRTAMPPIFTRYGLGELKKLFGCCMDILSKIL